MLTHQDITYWLSDRDINWSVKSVGTVGKTFYIPNLESFRLSIYVSPDECSAYDRRDALGVTTPLQNRQQLSAWMHERKHLLGDPWPSVEASFKMRGCTEVTQVSYKIPEYHADPLHVPQEVGVIYQAYAPDGALLNLKVNALSQIGTLSWQRWVEEDGQGTITETFYDEFQLRDYLREKWPIPRRGTPSEYMNRYTTSAHAEKFPHSAVMYSRQITVWSEESGRATYLGRSMIHGDCPKQAFRMWWWIRRLVKTGMARWVAETIMYQAQIKHSLETQGKDGEPHPNPTPMHQHILRELRAARSSLTYVIKDAESVADAREDRYREAQYQRLDDMFQWDEITRILAETDAEVEEFEDGEVPVARLCVGKVFDLTPSEKYYMPWARSHVTDAEGRRDEIFWEQFELIVRQKLGENYFIESGEGDPTDVFICVTR